MFVSSLLKPLLASYKENMSAFMVYLIYYFSFLKLVVLGLYFGVFLLTAMGSVVEEFFCYLFEFSERQVYAVLDILRVFCL